MGSTKEEIRAMCDDIRKGIKEVTARVTEVIIEDIDTAFLDAYEEFSPYEHDELKAILNDAIDTWYDSYDKRGPYQPQKRMKNYSTFMDYNKDEDGLIDTGDPGERRGLFKKSKDLGPIDRSGNSLFEKVFIEGWHGGAKYGPFHPNPGIPYYRTPYSENLSRAYKRWGKRAKRTESAYKIFDKKVTRAEAGYLQKELDNMIDKHIDKALDIIEEKKIPEIVKEVFG